MATMATLRRILKYTPAVVLGLLVVAWVVSVFFVAILAEPSTHRAGEGWSVELQYGSIMYHHFPEYQMGRQWIFNRNPNLYFRSSFGSLYAVSEPFPQLHVPIPLLITLVLPLAIGPFIRFRFRLWHYLAYTALVAVELAYYLQWQQ